MRPSFFATLAGMLAMAGVSIFQPTGLHAGTPLTGGCENAPCFSQAAQSKGGKLDQAPQMLAFEIKIRLECPDGFRREDGECLRDRRGKKKGGGGCVVGFHWNGDRCVRDRKDKQKGGGGCVIGFRWNGNKCVPDGQGQKKTKNNNEFPPIEGQEGGFSCSHNDHLEKGKCVPCKQGFHVKGDECVPD